MFRLSVLAFLVVCAFGAAAQSGQRADPGEDPRAGRDQRRGELREMLRPNRYPGANSNVNSAGIPGSSPGPYYSPDATSGRVDPAGGPPHQMTPRARAELREQLRQERLESRRHQP